MPIRAKVNFEISGFGALTKDVRKRVEKRLTLLAKEMVPYGGKALKSEIRGSKWSAKGPGSFADNSVSIVKALPNGVSFTVKHKAAVAQEEGVKPHPMSYIKPGTIVPITLRDGSVIFRRAGKKPWKHPGMKGKHFTRKAVDRTYDMYTAKIRDILTKVF
jgi:hypothetical protein